VSVLNFVLIPIAVAELNGRASALSTHHHALVYVRERVCAIDAASLDRRFFNKRKWYKSDSGYPPATMISSLSLSRTIFNFPMNFVLYYYDYFIFLYNAFVFVCVTS
jgi:hypothetical protein